MISRLPRLSQRALTPLRSIPPTRTLATMSPVATSISSLPAPSTKGTFRYLDPSSLVPNEKPWSKVDTGESTSWSSISKTKPVYNARDRSDDYKDVDRTGFAFYTSPSNIPGETVLTDDAAVRSGYYAEVEAALRTHLKTGDKVTKVIIFDHTVRVHDPSAPRQPVTRVHVDQTPAAAEARVRRHAGEDAERLLKGRYQLINVWRPLGHPATDFPLAVIDWRSAKNSDLQPVDLLYPKRQEGDDGDDRGKEAKPSAETLGGREGYEVKGETYSVKPNDAHTFWYVKDMGVDEVMFLKCFDSASEDVGGEKGLAGFTPHTAFVDENAKGAKPRQSIEVRALVFYE